MTISVFQPSQIYCMGEWKKYKNPKPERNTKNLPFALRHGDGNQLSTDLNSGAKSDHVVLLAWIDASA